MCLSSLSMHGRMFNVASRIVPQDDAFIGICPFCLLRLYTAFPFCPLLTFPCSQLLDKFASSSRLCHKLKCFQYMLIDCLYLTVFGAPNSITFHNFHPVYGQWSVQQSLRATASGVACSWFIIITFAQCLLRCLPKGCRQRREVLPGHFKSSCEKSSVRWENRGRPAPNVHLNNTAALERERRRTSGSQKAAREAPPPSLDLPRGQHSTLPFFCLLRRASSIVCCCCCLFDVHHLEHCHPLLIVVDYVQQHTGHQQLH